MMDNLGSNRVSLCERYRTIIVTENLADPIINLKQLSYIYCYGLYSRNAGGGTLYYALN